MEVPATLPGSLREQLLALMPYATERALSHGGFMIKFKIPYNNILTGGLDRQILDAHGIGWELREPERILSRGGKIMITSHYFELILTFRQ